MTAVRSLYLTDLAYVHHAGFGDLSQRVAPELLRILRRHGMRSARLVEAGCGSGSLAKHLTDAGHRVVAIDASAAMIRLARAHAPKARFRVASIETARIPRCDAVIAIGEVITYLASSQAVHQFFKHVRQALAPGGLFLFDFIESAERRIYPPKSRGGDDWALVAEASVSRDGRVRVYSREEIAAALVRAGFESTMRRSFGDHRLMASDVAVIARSDW